MSLRFTSRPAMVATTLPLLLLASCGGGGSGSTSAPATPTSSAPAVSRMSEVDAVRLAKQATFGPSQALIDRMMAADVDTWLTEQFAATGSTYSDLFSLAVPGTYCSDNFASNPQPCWARYFSRQPVAMRFYTDAVSQPDQLRQRVAFTLSQLLVASETEVKDSAGMASLNQIFLDQAFGNFHDILKAVMLNPYMGDYLDMADSSAATPNENFAREFLQLFSMGPNALNADGTAQLDSTGALIPNYAPADIKAVARALTGWSYARLSTTGTDYQTRDYSKPMVMVPARYDSGQKVFFGTTVPAGASQDASIQAVVDAAFNNAATPPYIAKFLIRHLVSDNPSAAYVSRVAAVFVNNGSGVRGDMKAIIRAILTDTEARGAVSASTTAGKVKEPILLMLALVRAVGMTTDGYGFIARDALLGQPAFRAPSVFNYYPPDYPLPQSATLVSPASKLMTAGYIVARHNFVWDWTIKGESVAEFAVQPSVTGATGSTLAWSSWEAITDVDALIDRVNALLLADTMTTAQRSALKQALLAVTAADAPTQARRRAETAFYIVATSPQFQVDR